MPCGRCQGTLVSIGGSWSCPPCEGNEIVPPGEAARALEAIALEAEGLLLAKMGGHDRGEVIGAAFGEREMMARGFLFGLKAIDIRTVLGCNAVLGKLGAKKAQHGGRPADLAPLLGLIQKFGNMLFHLEKVPELEAGTYNLLRAKKYGLDDLMSADPGAFPLYPNERHVGAFDARSDLGMVTLSRAERGAPPPVGDIWAALGAKKRFTVEGSVRDYYYPAYMFADVFFGTPVRRRYGAPLGLDQVKIPPLRLKKFVSLFPCDMDNITVCDTGPFEALARRVFGDKYPDFVRDFVAPDGCPGAFPLFIKIGGQVRVSQFFGEFYSCALLTVVHRAELDRETEHRSRAYESEVVPAYFRSRRYAYYADQGVKNTLQIDGVAVSPGVAYVIEAKYWNPRKFLGGAGRYRAYDDMIRGSIDGTHYDRGTKSWKKRGVALADKAAWVEENRGRYGIPRGTPIKRAVVTNTHPTAREYNGCEIVRVADPDALDAQDDAGGPAGAETPRGPAPGGAAYP